MRFLSTHISCLCRLLLLLLPALVVASACDKDSAAGEEGAPEYNTYLQITLHTGSMIPASRRKACLPTTRVFRSVRGGAAPKYALSTANIT